MASLTEAKLRPPRPRSSWLHRPRLTAALADTDARLVVVTGAAGFGKTALVSQWLAHPAAPARQAWLTIEARDNDPARFWTYVAGSLGRAVPGLTWSPPDVLRTDDLDELLEDVAAHVDEPTTLVLDDLHFLVEAPLLAQLEHVLLQLPDSLRAVVVSRTAPAMRLARGVVTGRVRLVDARALRFTLDETGAIVRRSRPPTVSGHDTEADVAAIQQLTGGWPVAVALLTRLDDGSPTAEPVRLAKARRDVASFLAEEVLNRQPEPVREFLLGVSVLDDVTVPAADAVLGSTGAAQHIDALQAGDLLLTTLDDGSTWRLHGLVRDLLRRQLQASDPALAAGLHRRAASYFERRDAGRAVDHLLMAGDYHAAAGMLASTVGTDRFAGVHQLLRQVDVLPDDALLAHPDLLAYSLGLANAALRHDLTRRLLRLEPPVESRTELLLALSWQAAQAGDLPRTKQVCAEALAGIDATAWQAQPLRANLAVAQIGLGELADAATTLRRMTGEARAPAVDHARIAIRIWAALACVLVRLGQLPEARRAVGAARTVLEAAGDAVTYRRFGLVVWADAMVALAEGDVVKAATWDQMPDRDEFSLRPTWQAHVAVDLATVRHSAGDDAGARDALLVARSALAACVDPGAIPQWADQVAASLGTSAIATNTGAATTAQPPSRVVALPDGTVVQLLSDREVEVLRMLRSEFSLPEIASQLYVSYNTAKTHVRVIYRKLGVGTRSSAVARARELGYL